MYIYKTTDTISENYYIGKHKGEFNPEYYGSCEVFNRGLTPKERKRNLRIEVIALAHNEVELHFLEGVYIRLNYDNEKCINSCKGSVLKRLDWNIKPFSTRAKGIQKQFELLTEIKSRTYEPFEIDLKPKFKTNRKLFRGLGRGLSALLKEPID